MAVRSRLVGTGAASATHAVTLPADAQTGDRVVVGFCNDHAHTTAAASTGWSSLGEAHQSTTTNQSLTVFTRVLDGGANDALTVTITDTVDGNAQAAAWTVYCCVGNGGTPQTVQFANGGSATTGTVTAITGITSDDYDSIVFLALDNSTALAHTVTAPTGWNLLTTAGISTDPVLAYGVERLQRGVTGFSPGNVTWTNAEQWITAHVVVPDATETRRFYLANAPADYTPGAAGAAFWDDTATALADPHRLTEVPAGGSASTAIAETSTDANWYVLLGQWVSAPASTSGTLCGAFYEIAAAWLESDAAANFQPTVTVYVIDAAGMVGSAPISQTAGNRELPTTAAGVGYFSWDDSSVVFAAGQRIVVDLGYRSVNTSATSFTGSLYRGGTGTPDLADGATDLTRPGWIDLIITPGVVFEEPDMASVARRTGGFLALL